MLRVEIEQIIEELDQKKKEIPLTVEDGIRWQQFTIASVGLTYLLELSEEGLININLEGNQ